MCSDRREQKAHKKKQNVRQDKQKRAEYLIGPNWFGYLDNLAEKFE